MKMSWNRPALLSSLLSLVVYINTFQADFVFDDRRTLLQNPDVLLQTPLSNLLVSDYWGLPLNHTGSHGSYRPLTVLSFRLNYYYFDLNSSSYHVINVVLHCVTTYLFCCVTATLLQFTTKKTLAAGLLFAVHPIHTEAVAGIVGRADILATMFCLTTLLSYQKACNLLSTDFVQAEEREKAQNNNETSNVQTLFHDKHFKPVRKKVRRRGNKKSKKQNAASVLNQNNLNSATRQYLEFKSASFDSGNYSDESTSTTDTFDSLTSSGSSVMSEERQMGKEAENLKQLHNLKNDEMNNQHQKKLGLIQKQPQTCTETDSILKNQVHSYSGLGMLLQVYRNVIYDKTRHAKTAGWSWLIFSAFNGFCSILSKESGYCAIPLCIVYEFFILHDLHLKRDTDRQKKHRQHIAKRIFFILSLWIGFVSFRIGLPLLLSSGQIVFPRFSPSDNPVAACDSFFTRVLTFNYLFACNLQMLFFPISLSFDWSMGAIPLVTSLQDERNILTLLSYVFIFKLLHFVFLKLRTTFNYLDSGGNLTGNSVTKSGVGGLTRLNSTSSEDSFSDSIPSPNVGFSFNKKELIAGKPRLWKSDQGLSEFAISKENRFIMVTSHLRLLFAFVIIIFGLLPGSNLLFYVGFVLAERVLFLPSVGSCILLVEGGDLMVQTILSYKNFFKSGSVNERRKYSRKNVPKSFDFLTPQCFIVRYFWLIILVIYFSSKTINRNRDWKDEISLYRSGVALNPAKAFANLGSALKTQGRNFEAESAYKEALRHRSNMADVHYNLGLLYQETVRHEVAEKHYRLAVHFRPAMAVAYLNLGVVLAKQNRVEEAKTIYRKAANLENPETKDPKTHSYAQISALFNLGCLLAESGDHHSAVEVFNEALSRPLNYYKPHSLYNMLGQSLFHLSRLNEAEKWFKASLSSKPGHVPAHLTYAQLLASRGKTDQARFLYERALQLEPHNKAVYTHYSSFLLKTNRHHKAAEILISAVESSFGNEDSELINNAARTLRQLKMYDKAEKYYILAAKLAPNVPMSFLNLGAIQHLQRKYELARKSYLKALELDPKNELTLENLSKLDRTIEEEVNS